MALARDFDEWYRRVHPRLVAALVLVTGDLDLTRDCVDEACLRAVTAWPRVSVMASPDGWAYRVALNVARRRLRRRGLERRLLAVVGRRAVVEPLPGLAGEIWAVVRGLSERQRSVVVLRYVGDMTEPDVAAALGISRSTVSSTLADAHRRLAPLLAEAGEGDRAGGDHRV